MIDGVAPISVVRPTTIDELCDEVAAADRDGVGVFPWGGGTKMSLGNIPQRSGVVIDTTALNRVVSHNAGDMTATFQAGATMETVAEVSGSGRPVSCRRSSIARESNYRRYTRIGCERSFQVAIRSSQGYGHRNEGCPS